MTGFVNPELRKFVPIKPINILHPPCWKWDLEIIDLNCKTRILWVMDGGLDMNASNGFGLTEAKSIVEAATATKYPVEITTAHRSVGTGCDVNNFTFDGTHTVGSENRSISYYEEIWIFSISSTANELDTATELPVLEDYMSNGGGVFATGDHADLGAGVCENIPRVKSMRKWRVVDGAPTGNGPTRIDTNVPSSVFSPDFDLQSDSLAQRIYPVWQGTFDSTDYLPHPVLEMPDGKAVTHLPDHPHEGKCVIPNVLDPAEYPEDDGGVQVAPELIAYGVSGGAGFNGSKPSITPPELFGVLGAYDGHQAGIGRVVVDSTWHHWLNINLNGTGAGTINGVIQNGLYDAMLNPTPEYLEIQRYFQNIAAWLEPNRYRICFVIRFICRRWHWPFIEEFEIIEKPDFGDFVRIGEIIEQTILPFEGKGAMFQLLSEILDATGAPRIVRNTFNPLYRGKETISISPLVRGGVLVHALLGGAFHELMKELPEDQFEAMKHTKTVFDKSEDDKSNPLFRSLASGVNQAMELLKEELHQADALHNDFSKALE